ncbi:DNA/RNA non-specific endonuclease [Deinococcus multiflagellatus]|uniref:DNA/RNA non-specific endonuclease n=1 Tax=Deinococcus multiflagellatus TaxID=1656887 RepID=A0ABW1ZTE9_9DEIO|nr:DNA/RNA non-specific endonuclease [Deinococcus multiflagellatus]MBZ9715944.1 DNA/RNA non-specific endonuclease [Deinococcus multiflagellatus]
MKQPAALLLASLLLAACSPSPAPVATAAPYDRLMQSVGGEAALAQRTQDMTPREAEAFFAAYGMGYQNHDALSAQLADGCPTRFAAADRNTWHTINGGYYYIDGEGRPKSAYRYLPPITAAARDTTCQASVGNLDHPDGYDGGHLVGSQLGGWGRRANMVPQDSNFNRGNYAQIENQAAKCTRLANGALTYQASVTYPNTTTNTPSTWTLSMTIGGDTFTRTFTNTAYGGPNGTTYRQQAVSWLISKGCS